MNIPVVYEDGWLLVADKPSGLLVIPTPKNEPRTLTSILNDESRIKKLSYQFHPCHRLDRETSGLIIYAKGSSVQKKMMQEFKDRKVKKTYIAFLQGKFLQKTGEITMPLEGCFALTKYRVVRQLKDFSVAEVFPVTGRTNQIRIHFKKIGHPVVGEDRFAFRKDYALRAKRLCLHARTVEFIHPVTKENLRLDSPLPLDMEKFLTLHPN